VISNLLHDASVVLALNAVAFHTGRIKRDVAGVISGCADDFINLDAFMTAQSKKSKIVTGLNELPKLDALKMFLVTEDYSEALIEAERIRSIMGPILERYSDQGKK